MAGRRWIGIGTGRAGFIRLAALGVVAAVAALTGLASMATASAKRPAAGRPAVGQFGSQGGTHFGLRGLSALGRGGVAHVAGAGDSGSSVPSPGKNGELASLACQKASDCWAVGVYENTSTAFLNQALRWNGKKWSVVKTPDPGGKATGDLNELGGVACVKPSDCWAVGFTESGSHAADLNQALHWNGKRWSLVKTPDPAGKGSDDENILSGVACVKASDCWAVGDSESGSGAAVRNEALRWNGKRWSVVKTPDPAGTASGHENELNGVACVRASHCWAVGLTERGSGSATLNEALRWNGKRWSVVKTPDPAGKGSDDDNELDGVRCVTASDCWAVGRTASGIGTTATDKNQALRWNGKKWSVIKTPQPSTVASEFDNPLVSVFCTSAKNCWAVGWSVNKTKTALLNEAVRWDGKRWSRVATPQPGGRKGLSALLAVRCVSASDCRAVGTDGPSLTTLSNQALRWNGKKWATG